MVEESGDDDYDSENDVNYTSTFFFATECVGKKDLNKENVAR